MPLTRSEIMYFAVGVAVGGAAGANWKKIKPFVEMFMGPAQKGFEQAYTDAARMFGNGFEGFEDHVAENNHRRSAKPRNERKRTRRRSPANHSTNGAANGAPLFS